MSEGIGRAVERFDLNSVANAGALGAMVLPHLVDEQRVVQAVICKLAWGCRPGGVLEFLGSAPLRHDDLIDPASGLVQAPSDLAVHKPGTDVIVACDRVDRSIESAPGSPIELTLDGRGHVGRAPDTGDPWSDCLALHPADERRLGHAGAFDSRWQEERWPLPPRDFSPRFWQVAPSRLQFEGFVEGGETLRCRGPGDAREERYVLQRGPCRALCVATEDGLSPIVRLNADTVEFDPVEREIRLTIRGLLPLLDPDLSIVII